MCICAIAGSPLARIKNNTSPSSKDRLHSDHNGEALTRIVADDIRQQAALCEAGRHCGMATAVWSVACPQPPEEGLAL